MNETYSKSYGIEAVSGKDEWNWYAVPTLRFIYNKDIDWLSLSASGQSYRPSQSRMMPVLNVANPSRLGVGNVYLKPSSQMYFNADWSRNNVKRFSHLMVYFYGGMTTNPFVNATWYDQDGILYSVPVNSRKPGLTGTMVVNYTTPLDSKKLWSLTLSGAAAFNSSVSYQARTALPGLDKDTFDYAGFMAGFWVIRTAIGSTAGRAGLPKASPGSFLLREASVSGTTRNTIHSAWEPVPPVTSPAIRWTQASI